MLFNAEICVFNREWVKNHLITTFDRETEKRTEKVSGKALSEILIKQVKP